MLRVAIIGGGWAARHLHAPALRGVPGAELVAIVDPREHARRAFPVQGYPDVAALVRAGECDAVIVASPPDTHAAAAVEALEAGLHVLVEKPLATTRGDAERIAAVARAGGRVLGVGFNLRCHPAVAEVLAGARAAADRPTAMEVTWSTCAGLTARDWLGMRERGGGALFDLGSHVIDLWRCFGASEIAELSAKLREGPIDDAEAELTGRLENGTRLSARLSLLGPDRFEITMRFGQRAFRIRPYRSGLQASYARQWRAFARAIEAGTAPAADVHDGLAALAAIETVLAEHSTRPRPVPPPASFPITLLVATARDFAAVGTTVAHFARQTIARSAELIVVGPSEEALRGVLAVQGSFGSVAGVSAGHNATVGEALAAGVRRARGRVVAFAEDHCFPDADWAAALVRAHESDCSVVGPAIRNANPGTTVSGADFAMAYGPWMDPVARCEQPFLPGHNSSYKRDELLALGDRLPLLLNTETVLHMQWTAEGRKLRVEPAARMRHVNFSRWNAFILSTFFAGRAFAAARAQAWPRARRLGYAGASPLIPAIRLVRIAREFARPGRSVFAFARMLPTLMVGLCVNAAGECIGYAFGPGNASHRLATYEYNRRDHVRPSEQALWISP